MKVVAKMMYLGFETRTSNKSGKSYLLVKFMEVENSSLFEFYVPSDKIGLVTSVGQTKPFTEKKVTLAITSFNNKAGVDLEGME